MDLQHSIYYGQFRRGLDPIPAWAYDENGDLRAETFDSTIVKAILLEAKRFHYVDNIGHASLRLEEKKKGCWYWYAYHRRDNKLYKRYVCDSSHHNLTAENIRKALLRMPVYWA